MIDFSEEIDNFKKYGVYDYKFDVGGNLVFKKNSLYFEERYLSIPLISYVYDDKKINSFYDTQFSEFVVENFPTENLFQKPEFENLENENKQLKEKLASLVERVDENITESERLAVKQIILDLRIALKQGVSEKDFSITFPYLPITKH